MSTMESGRSGADRRGTDASPGAATVLLIEDEEDLRLLVRTVLEGSGFRMVEARDGHSGVRAVHDGAPDVVVLDIGLPDLDGWKTLERIRTMSDVPILVLTARAAETDKVRGLQAGADDYLTKPFSRGELLARLQALVRRAPAGSATRTGYADAALEVDFEQRRAQVGGREVDLTPMEFRLLAALVRHAGQVLSGPQLVELAWDDPSAVGVSRVKFTVLRLRRKLGWSDPRSSPIESVRGFGYRYRRPEEVGAAGGEGLAGTREVAATWRESAGDRGERDEG